MMITYYEVFSYDALRGWMLRARFSGSEYANVLTEAKDIERRGAKVKISREIYDSEENTSDDRVIYVSRFTGRVQAKAVKKDKIAAKVSAKPLPQRIQPMRPLDHGVNPGTAPKAQDRFRTFTQISFIVLIGMFAGILVLRLLPLLLGVVEAFGFQVGLSPQTYHIMVLVTFAVVFLLVSTPLSLRLLPHLFKPDMPTRIRHKSRKDMKTSLDNLSRQALMEEQKTERNPAPLVPVADSEPMPEFDVTEAGLAPLEATRRLTAFVESAVAAIQTTTIQLDNYNKFALYLYIAGAVDILGEEYELGFPERRQLTAFAVSKLGTKADAARALYDRIADYLIELRYNNMVFSGRLAMIAFLNGDKAAAHSQLIRDLNGWNQVRTAQQIAPTMTVMFTDIIGSTDMAQTLGDAVAHEFTRTHNLIVRMAITQFGGKEVKHTGDGIMATFDDCTKAVDASIAIQRGICSHNMAKPHQNMLLRIGLNAGKPIHEENDIFGTVVQLAARACDASKPAQILCCQSVAKQCLDRCDVIVPNGLHELKGFKDPVPLYQICW